MDEIQEICRVAWARGLPAHAWFLVVDVNRQQLIVCRGGDVHSSYPVSTSQFGVGQHEGSYRTPPGFHEVDDRIGSHAELGQVFESRIGIAKVIPNTRWSKPETSDRILTRILRLRGLEPGLNQGPGIDSYDRHIYIHGTNQEHRLGSPASRGCIRMGNRNIVDLFLLLDTDPAWCWIGIPAHAASVGLIDNIGKRSI